MVTASNPLDPWPSSQLSPAPSASSHATPEPDPAWKNRSVLVTGASRGIGASLARRWLAKGATVFAHCRHGAVDQRLAPLTENLPGAEDRLHGLIADAAIPGAMGHAFRTLLEAGHEIDAIFFNHGTTTFTEDGEQIQIGPPSTFDGEQMRTLVQINALSVWEALHEIGRFWAHPEALVENDRRKRAIVLESSSGALNPDVFDPSPYKVSKAMLLHFVRDLAPEFARYRISINAVSPGMIDTGLSHLPCVEAMRDSILKGIPMGRYGDPEELFETVNFFLSGRASFSTGNNLTLNGGAYVISQ